MPELQWIAAVLIAVWSFGCGVCFERWRGWRRERDAFAKGAELLARKPKTVDDVVADTLEKV